MTLRLPRPDAPRVSVIIPTRSVELTRAALTSLEADAGSGVAFETIVVVNGAGDHFADELSTIASGIEIVRSAVDRGVPGGYNLGRTVATGDLIALMHDDVEVEPGWLQAWIDAADSHPEAGVFGSKVLFPDRRLAGAGNILWRDATTSPPWRGKAPPSDSFAAPRTVDYAASCSLLVRADVWDRVGGLNDDLYPAYYVDVDLAMSVRRLGWSVLYWPQSVVLHHTGAARRKRWPQFVAVRNRERFIERWADDLARQPDDGDIDAAVTRAANWTPAADSTAYSHDAAQRLLPRANVDPDDAYYIGAEIELLHGYVRHLETSLDAAEERLEESETRVVRAPAVLYQRGTRIEFSTAGTAGGFATAGGYGAEPWGVWLGDDPFVVELPLAPMGAEPEVEGNAVLALELTHYLSALRPVSPITVDVNGRRVLAVAESRPGIVAYEVPIGVHQPPGSRYMTIVISGADGVSPAESGDSADQRRLSVGVLALSVA